MATIYTREQHDDVPILMIENEEMFENDPERDKHLSRRRLARERVLQVIYAHLMNDRDTDELFFEMIQSDVLLNEQAIEFSRQLIRHYNVHKHELNEVISKHLAHWDVSRVAQIDKILLQIGILEFKYFPDIPPKATINELIEIAKDFSTDESGKFINGILHAIKEDLLNSGEMKKEGRGLLEQSL